MAGVLVVAGWGSLPRGGRGWVMWLRSGVRVVQVGCGLPVTPKLLWDASPYLSLAPGPVT
jgi:hypothetical protein